MKKSLDNLVSELTRPLAILEDKIISFPFTSGIAISHPKIASGIIGLSVFGGFGLLKYIFANIKYNLPVLSNIHLFAGIVFGILYTHTAYTHSLSKRNSAAKEGVNVAKLHELKYEQFHNKLSGNYKGFSGLITKSIDMLLSHPRTVSVAGASAILYFLLNHGTEELYIPSQRLPLAYLWATSAVYLSLRSILLRANLVFSSTSRKLFYHDLAYSIAKIMRNKNNMLKHLKINESNWPSTETKLHLAKTHLEMGNLDEGLIKLKEALEYKADTPSSYIDLGDVFAIDAAADAHKAIKQGKANHANYLFLAKIHNDTGEIQKSEREITRMRKAFPGIESDILSAIFFHAIGHSREAQPYWNGAIEKIISNENLPVLPTGEGLHRVWRYGPTKVISNTLLFKEGDTFDELQFEQETISKMRQTLRNPHFTLPNIITIFEHKNSGTKYNLVMRYLEGEDLVERQQKHTLTQDDLSAVIEYLALIYGTAKPDWSKKGNINLYDKFKRVIKNSYLNLSTSASEELKAAIIPLLRSLEDSPLVFGKDPHPRQWIFGRDYLAALDWNDMGVVNMFPDMAKLLVYPDLALTASDIDGLQGKLYASMKKQGVFTGNETDFRLKLLNGMIYQPISFISAWSMPQVPHMKEKRIGTLNTVAQTIELVLQNHKMELHKHDLGKENYVRAEAAINSVKTELYHPDSAFAAM